MSFGRARLDVVRFAWVQSGACIMATLGTDDRKQPPENAAHVRNAIARFNWVKSVSDTDRDAAWKRIKAAGEKVRRK